MIWNELVSCWKAAAHKKLILRPTHRAKPVIQGLAVEPGVLSINFGAESFLKAQVMQMWSCMHTFETPS